MKFKKPIFWDYKKPNYLSYLLLPLTLPVIINNFFLNLKIKKICIGNIYVGGTAKTPLTIKIYRILSDLKFKTATIKKFYKKHYDEQEILSQETKLYCNKNRVDALDEAIKDNVAVAIFDDGLQDKSMDYDLKFVCFNNSKWVGNGFLIPAGPLRETISSLSKYDSVFLNGNEKDNSDIKMLLKKYNKEIQIFEATYKVINLNKLDIKKKYVIFSGIGNPDSFKETLTKHNFNIVKEIIFPDHYNYTPKDIDYIRLQAKKLDSKILTTEKDYIKIKTDSKKDINFLKIDLNIKDESKLIDYLKLHI